MRYCSVFRFTAENRLIDCGGGYGSFRCIGGIASDEGNVRVQFKRFVARIVEASARYRCVGSICPGSQVHLITKRRHIQGIFECGSICPRQSVGRTVAVRLDVIVHGIFSGDGRRLGDAEGFDRIVRDPDPDGPRPFVARGVECNGDDAVSVTCSAGLFERDPTGIRACTPRQVRFNGDGEGRFFARHVLHLVRPDGEFGRFGGESAVVGRKGFASR